VGRAPARLSSLTTRRHVFVLAAIALVGLGRGLFWVAATEFPNPVDEAHHYAYVESLAHGHLPVVGKDKVSAEVLAMIKDAPTLTFRSGPYRPTPADPQWGPVREQYEAMQPPLYYAVMVPVYWAVHPFGAVKAFYAMRVASLLLALTAVPLTWLLARRLFPSRPEVWLAGPLVLVAIQGFNANLASVSNDVLVVPLAAAVLLLLLRDWERRTVGSAALAGVAFGAAMLAKTTAIGLGFVALFSFVLAWRQGLIGLRTLVTRMAAFGGAALLVFAPWLASNVANYSALSAAKEFERIHGPGVHGGFFDELNNARRGFWDFQLTNPHHGAYDTLFEVLLVVSVVVLVAGLLSNRREDRRAVAWLGGTVAASVGGMLFITYGLISGGGFSGRHLYIALVPAALLIGAGLVAIGGVRWRMTILLAGLTAALALELALVHRAVVVQYTSAYVRPGIIPAVDQNWGDDLLPGQPVRLSPPCRARYIAVRTAERGPSTVAVLSAGMNGTGRRIGQQEGFTVYRLAEATDQPITVVLPPDAKVSSSQAERSPAVAFPIGYGEAVARVYCPSAHAREARFAAVYPVQHPGRVTWAHLMGWPAVWIGIGSAGVVAAVIVEATRRHGRQSATHASVG